MRRKNLGSLKIALIGAGGATFGSLMAYEAARAEGLRGAEVALIDIDEKRLDLTRAAAERINEATGSPLLFSCETDAARGLEGADYVVLSVEVGRWDYWKQDLEIPCKYGSLQDMGENGGPGGLFHALRAIPLCLGVCKVIEDVCPEALLVNVTNPLPRINMAIHKATRLNCIGDCPELRLALPRLAACLLKPIGDFCVSAWGLNHFTWIHELKERGSGKDLYPALKRHIRRFPFLHGKLARRGMKEFGLYPVSTDSHIGEYLPSEGRASRSVLPEWFPYQKFSETECAGRLWLTRKYGEGRFKLPLRILPKAVEGTMLLIEALAAGVEASFGAVNVLNGGFIPNLPEWAVVEVPAKAKNGKLLPEAVPPIKEPLASRMREQCEVQRLIVESVLQKDPGLALEALRADPLAPPTEERRQKMFEEMWALQKAALPF